MSSSTQSNYNNTNSQLLTLLQSLPTEMVRRHLLYLADVLLQDRNRVAHQQVHERVSSTGQTQPSPTPRCTLTRWLIDAISYEPLGSLEIFRSPNGTRVLVFFPDASMELPKPMSGALTGLRITMPPKPSSDMSDPLNSREQQPAPNSPVSIRKDVTVALTQDELTALSQFLPTLLTYARPHLGNSGPLSTDLHKTDTILQRLSSQLSGKSSYQS